MERLTALLKQAASMLETLSFIVATILAVLADGQLNTGNGKAAVIAAAVGATSHAVNHPPTGTARAG